MTVPTSDEPERPSPDPEALRRVKRVLDAGRKWPDFVREVKREAYRRMREQEQRE